MTTFDAIIESINSKRNFILEAGAGSGKTHTLIQVLHYLDKKEMSKSQSILCITYTNVAKYEIINRLEGIKSRDKYIVSTMHDFIWGFISGFQKDLQKIVEQLSIKKIEDLNEEIRLARRKIENPRANTNIANQKEIIERNTIKLSKFENVDYSKLIIRYDIYTAYYRGVISHDDIIFIMKLFLENLFFLQLFITSNPYIMIDEYQDIDFEILKIVIKNSIKYGLNGRFVIGLFGDRMQQIYKNSDDLDSMIISNKIKKIENYRSNIAIINANNSLRDDTLKQKDDITVSNIEFNNLEFVYNTSNDIDLRNYLKNDFPNYKRLYLRNKEIAKEIGFNALSELFSSTYHKNANEKLLKLDDQLLNFIMNEIIAYIKKYKRGEFSELITRSNASCINDLIKIKSGIESLLVNSNMNIMQFIDEFKKLIEVNIERMNLIIDSYENIEFVNALISIPLVEFINLEMQISGETSLSTMHGVKGAEFDNVIVNIFENQTWNIYDFNSVLLNGVKSEASILRAHKLLYVACTRAKSGLVINYLSELNDTDYIHNFKQKIQEVFGPNMKFTFLK